MGQQADHGAGDRPEEIRSPVEDIAAATSRSEGLQQFVQGAEGRDGDDGQDGHASDSGCGM